MLVDFSLLVILMIVSAGFSASETAYFTLDPVSVAQMKRHGGLSALVASLGSDLHALLLVTLFGNMAANVSFFAVSFGVSRYFGPRWTVLAGALATAALILFGEVLPKLLSARAPFFVAHLVAVPLYLFSRTVRPGTALLARLPIAGALASGEQSVTKAELKMLVEMTRQAGEIDTSEHELISEVVKFGDIIVSEAMVPRVDMIEISLPAAKDDALRKMKQSGVTKIAVWERTRDNVLGYLDGKDLLLDKETDLRKLIRPVLVVPETKKVEELLRQFIAEGTRFAVVVDEYGGTEGIVTLEHLLEEIVGDIEGEGSPPSQPAVQDLGGGRYLVRGNLSLRDWGETFGRQLDVRTPGTIGGLVNMLLGRVPREGDSVRYEGMVLTVQAVERRRVTKIVVEESDRGGRPRPGRGAQWN